MGVNVKLTPFSFDVSAKLTDRKEKEIQSRHDNYIDGQMREKTSLSDEDTFQGICYSNANATLSDVSF